MFKRESRRGFALSAIFSLVVSALVAAPAAQATESGVVVAPIAGTSYTTLIGEAFTVKTRLGSQVDSANISKLKYIVSKPAGYRLSVSSTVSATIPSAANIFDGTKLSASPMAYTATTSVITPFASTVDGVNILSIAPNSVSGITSVSPAVTVTVTAFLDLTPDGILDSSEPSETVTVNFVKWSALGATLDLTQPTEGATWVTASARVSGVNFEQLGSTFRLYFNTKSEYQAGDLTYASASSSPALSGQTVADRSGVISHSEEVAPLTISPSVNLQTVSAVLVYGGTDPENILAYKTLQVSAQNFDDVTISPIIGDNLAYQTTDTADARVNSAFSLTTKAFTGSATVAAAVAAAKTLGVTYTANSTGDLSTEKYVVINAVAYTSSSALPTTSALATGTATIAVSTVGFTGGESLAFLVTAGSEEYTYTVDIAAPTYSITHSQYVSVKPGSAVTLEASVTDQWDVASSRTNQKVVSYWVATDTHSGSSSVSTAVVGGSATVTANPSPATATGSATLRVTLQSQNLDNGLWTNVASNDVTVNVSALADGFTVSPTATVSASISYALAAGEYSWSGVISGTSTNLGALVTVANSDLVFFDVATGKTASGTISIRSGASGAFSFKAAATKAGVHTVSMTINGSVTTSQVIVDAAGDNMGASVSWNKTSILAGTTATLTGTLVDKYGNPVHTSGSATIAVTYKGTGIAIGTMPEETDEDGEFSFTVLAGSSDAGTATVTAVYKKNGAGSATADTVTFAQSLTVGAASASADQKLTIGTFNGYIAIYAKGYTGQKLSYKVAGKWGTVASLSAFQRVVRKTGAGYEIAVVLYIDGVKIKTETVTTK